MKRAHRRMHLILWLAILPAAAAGLALALLRAPPGATSELPPAILGDGGR